MRRSKVSSEGQGGGERRSGGGAEIGSVSSPTSTTPRGKKSSMINTMRGGGLQGIVKGPMRRVFGKGVVFMVRRRFIWALGLVWVVSVVGLT